MVSAVAPDSLIALRLLSAMLAARAVVILTGLIACELGGRRPEQLLASSCMAVPSAMLLIGHLFGTTMINLFCWVAVCWAAAHASARWRPALMADGGRDSR